MRSNIDRELLAVDIALETTEGRTAYQKLMRKRKRLLRRRAGDDVRWTMGIEHGGGVPPERLKEYHCRLCLQEIKRIIEKGAETDERV